MEWIKQQPDANSQIEMEDPSALNLLETLNVKHIKLESPETFLSTTFAMSQQSHSFGIASRGAKPSFSIMYPGTDKAPLVLSRDGQFSSALDITIAGQEYLVASSKEDIHLWNLANNTSSVVYKFKEQKDWHICVIDERTIACVAELPTSGRHFSNIYILNTDSEKFNLNSKIPMRAEGTITDICYVKTTDHISCLILSKPVSGLIQSLEMVGGKVHWQLSMQQMGQSFHPFSICTDGNIVFVADVGNIKLYLLSVDDGAVITSISLVPFGIRFPICVRLQGELLYVGYELQKETYCISKFTKPSPVSGLDM